MVKYDITRRAREDLFSIWEYTVERWSEEQADKYYGELVAGMGKVAATPLKIGKPYDEILPGLRAYHVRKHMVFYIIQDNGRALIVRVLHERMEYSYHFVGYSELA